MSIPTLVVGLGGTGVLTLRALKKLYEGLPIADRVLASFLAFDLDRSAMESASEDTRFATLTDSEFFFLDPRRIQEALHNLDRIDESGFAWENILRWFPDCSASEVKANGPSRFRVLGRLGFFLYDHLIEGILRRRLNQLNDNLDPAKSRYSEDKRVILVSSIAGGTGAGMLVDTAYLIRRQELRPRVFAYLLLPEVFEHVAIGGRIYETAYACLKELACLKDR